MRHVIVFVTIVLAGAEAFSQTGPPNVLVIYADQYRWDCMGAMGHPDVETPHLDALAGDGVLYRDSFCVWPVCTPSRLSLLTGQYVQQHGGSSNRSTLVPGTPTFAGMLRDAGYETKAVGKMHFTPAYQDVGFSEMILAEQNGRGRNVDDYHRYLKDRGLINAIDLIDQEWQFRRRAPERYWETFGAQVSDLPDEHHITTWVGDRAVESVREWSGDASNLLMAGFLKPHHPLDPPAPWHERYDPDDMTVLPGWTDEVLERDRQRARGYFDYEPLTIPALKRASAYYYATITHMDHHIGRIVEELKEKGEYDNTLIVFTADHGEYLGFHHLLLKGNHMYDPLVKVPLIIKFPGQKHKGIVSDELVNTLDVTSTILDVCGKSNASDMRGAALGKDGPGRERPRDFVVTEDRMSVMVRSHTRKLIYASPPERSLFFDLEADPLEMDNVINDPRYADDVQAMMTTALDWFLSDTRRRAYVDESVRLVDAPNVPEDLKQTEREMLEYFEEKVEPFLVEPSKARER